MNTVTATDAYDQTYKVRGNRVRFREFVETLGLRYYESRGLFASRFMVFGNPNQHRWLRKFLEC